MHGYTERKNGMGRFILGSLVGLLWTAATLTVALSGQAQESGPRVYVGSSACKPCHPNEFKSFTEYSRKSHSYRSIQRMQKGLSNDEVRECYACHTTGYGKPGGFISIDQTPDLKDAGCEVCHGAGKGHVETQDPAMINGKVTVETCQRCHIQDRLRAFRYRPLLHGGAH